LGDEEGWRVVEWPSICNFILLIHLEIERVCRDVKLHSISGHKNATTPSRTHTEQVAPSWLRFEASSPLES
jgi:hypothetical protein